MNRKLLGKLYYQIAPSTTQWLPRYYNVMPFVTRLSEQKGGLVLDASCGTGDTTIELKKTGTKVIGLNISEEEIMIARRKAKEEGVEVDFIIGDLTRCPLRDRAFSQIISLDTLEHIEDDNAVFREFARILKSLGSLILSVPFGATNSAQLFREQRMLRRVIPRFIYAGASYNGRSWLEATREDAMTEMGHLRDYSIEELEPKTEQFFSVAHYEYALKRFGSLATDVTYGIKGLWPIKPFMFYIAVRLDHYFQKKSKGYLLIVDLERKDIGKQA